MTIYLKWGEQDKRQRRGETQDLKLKISISVLKAVAFMGPKILCRMSALWTPESDMEQEVGRKR